MAIVLRGDTLGKVCKICQEWKPLREFKGNGRSSDGYDHQCRSCRDYRQIQHFFVDGVEGKHCTACGEWKPLDCYVSASWLSDGKHSQCDECRNERKRERYAANRDERRRKNTESYYRNREKRLARGRQYRAENLDKIRARERDAKQRRYWDRLPEERERSRLAIQRRRKRERDNGEGWTPEQFQALCEQYDFRCLCCGKQEPEIKLAADHVVPLILGGAHDLTNIQPLCIRCNRIKGTSIIDYR